jgi:GTP-binding protein YchF
MTLSIGIVGLPNVGKSTVFNALTKTQYAEVANYPFCTIRPNRAIVPVPDERVEKIAELVNVPEIIRATVEFVDIAGLVRGASHGEGLGNQFLANIRDTEAILHVVRCFEDPNVVHVSGAIDPREDIEIINLELALADLEQLDRKLERLASQMKGDRKVKPALDLALALKSHLEAGQPVSQYPHPDDEPFRALIQEMRFLTNKPVIYVANVDESSLTEESKCLQEVRQIARERGAEMVGLAARMEEQLAGLNDEERKQYLELAGVEESGLEKTIRKSYEALHLITFFTFNEREVRAWTIAEGWTAPQAAGVIHTDFERGFIRAEVLAFDTFVKHGSWGAARAAGALGLEGKEYVVQDGDIIYFRFNV